jgi:hypothetical protein
MIVFILALVEGWNKCHGVLVHEGTDKELIGNNGSKPRTLLPSGRTELLVCSIQVNVDIVVLVCVNLHNKNCAKL